LGHHDDQWMVTHPRGLNEWERASRHQSVLRFCSRRLASGAQMAMMAADHSSATSTGCWAGKLSVSPAGLGLPNSSRHDPAIEHAVRTKASSRRDQVRMICALGAVTGFDDWAPELMTELPLSELRAELTAAVRDILGLPDIPTASAAPAAQAAG
jgi:hypothetical protein